MPVVLSDGRKGLILISKEYEGAYYLKHFRTKGSKNGVRLYQYKDGSYTPLGRIHYGIGKGRNYTSEDKDYRTTLEREKDAVKSLDRFDKLSKKEQLDAGDEILNLVNEEIKSMENERSRGDDESTLSKRYESFGSIYNKLSDRIIDRSGTVTYGGFWKGPDGKKAFETFSDTRDKMHQRQMELAKQLGDDVWKRRDKSPIVRARAERKQRQLQRLLRTDAVYKSYKEALSKSETDLCGAVLKDIGFRDTPENREIIFPFIF